MPDIVLSEREQAALRALIAEEPVPGDRLPSLRALAYVDRLIPSDDISVSLADSTGCVVDCRSLPGVPLGDFDPQVCDGPLPLGVVHQGVDPSHRELGDYLGITDGLVVGFRNGRDHVVQLCLDRKHRTFSERDVAVLWMISPALERIMRTSMTLRLPVALTVQERRVLQLVARGMSNADIAVRLYVAPSTVRKHLEHAFRKLGVSNRMAAVVALEQGLPAGTRSGTFA